MSSLRFENVTKIYARGAQQVHAFANLSLQIEEGAFVCLLGPSGCGKTTMLRLFAGLESPTSGNVLADSKTVRSPGPDRAVVFQQFALFPWMTVQQNIEFGPRCVGVAKSERQRRSRHYIE